MAKEVMIPTFFHLPIKRVETSNILLMQKETSSEKLESTEKFVNFDEKKF